MQAKNEITIYDIAAALDISPSTVSRALSGVPLVHKETRKKILAAARQMGYRQNVFASKLRSQHTKMLGAVVHSLNTATASGVISAAECVARCNGYSLIITQTLDGREEYISAIERLNRHRVDGMLICNMGNKFLDAAIPNHEIPTVIIEKAIVPDNAKLNPDIAYKFARQLLDNGCKNIVLMLEHANASDVDEVFLGCQTAIAESESRDCLLAIQTKSKILANTASGNPDGIIYIGAVFAMLFIPHDKLNRRKHGIGISDDVSDVCPDKFIPLGDFAAEILLSLLKRK
jgi:LacI family transcriptional regulator